MISRGDPPALHGGHRRQRQAARQVAGRVDVRDVRSAVGVDGDVAALIHLHARRLEPETLAVRDRPDGEQGVAAPSRPAVVAPDGDAVALVVDPHGTGALEQLDAAAQELVLERGGHLRVLLGEDLLAGHDQGHGAAQRREHVHELDPGHARPDHDEVLGPVRRRIGVARGQHPGAVDRGPLREAGTAARGEDDGVGLQPQLAVGPADRHLVLTREPAGASQQLDTLPLQELGRLRLEAVLDGVDPRPQDGGIHPGDGGRQAHLGRAPHGRERAAGRDHRLGRDAVARGGPHRRSRRSRPS